jgi:hypothetical protein
MAISRRPNGNLVITVRITFRPGRDDDLIDLISAAPRGALAGLIRESMRNGVQVGRAIFMDKPEDEPLEMSGLGMEI